MSAPIKRHADSVDIQKTEKCSTFTASKHKLNVFIEWAERSNFNIHKKVDIGVEKSCAQYGLIAVEDIQEGELLFQIPRTHLITPCTCAIADILKKDEDAIRGSSGWAPVLIALMHEYNNPQSLWRPYLDLVPDFKELDLPMFWSSSEREELLAGTRVVEAVNTDLQNIETEFKQVVLPFIEKHEHKFSAVCKDLEFYKKMVAFVMAYSFTDQGKQEDEADSDDDGEEDENPPPMMVPIADILNHVAKNNAHLNYDKDALRMVAIKPISKGEEIYNTYGELANWDLLHMYGFSEPYPNNHYDTVDIPSVLMLQAAGQLIKHNTEDLMKQKQEFLENFGFVGDATNFVVGVEGVLSEEEMIQTVKVLLMTEAEFTTHVEEEGWEEEDENEISLTFENGAVCSLLVIVLDTNPVWWGRNLVKGDQQLLLTKCVDSVMTFANSHLIMSYFNKLALIAAHTNASHFMFPKRTATGETVEAKGDETHDGKYEMFEQMNHQIKTELKDFVLNSIEYEMENDSLIAGAVSMALCYIHRMEKECPVGVTLSSRILVIKGCDDNPAQYMNFMNSVFTAQKQNVVIDACLLENDSGLLQQACDITGGVYLKIPQPAGLLQYLLWVFLPDPKTREKLTLPPKTPVDYRAACFCHRNLIDIGYVCSVCLSIFCTFSPICSTCQTTFKIMAPTKMVKKKKKAAS